MNINKGMALSLAACMAVTPMVVKAEDMEIIPISAPISAPIEDERVMYSEYIEFRGKVEEIYNEDGQFYILATNGITEGGLNALKAYIDEDVILLNNKDMEFASKDDLKVGTEVVIYYHKDTIMALSYPPMLGPDVVIINDNEEQGAMVSKFDGEFLNAEKDLYARPSDETIIIDKDGNVLTKDDVKNRDLIIFYDIVLESYPAQTTPKKVIVMPEREEMPVVNEFVLENFFVKDTNGVKMIPLRLVAEALGYEVSWNQETKTAEVVRGAQWTSVTIGQDRYSFAKMLVELGTAAELIDEKTYVPMNFIEEILKAGVEVVAEGLKIIY